MNWRCIRSVSASRTSCSPEAQQGILDGLLSRAEWIPPLLDAVEPLGRVEEGEGALIAIELALDRMVESRLEAEDAGQRGDELARLVPGIGPTVAGASYCRLDGCANPLRLLRALHAACQRLGGRYLPGSDVESVRPLQAGYAIETASGTLVGDRLVLAAGLGNARLAPSLGMATPVKPVRETMSSVPANAK